MKVGIALPATADAVGNSKNAVDLLIDQAGIAAAAGVSSLWFSQRFDIDALTLVAAVAREVPEVELGTSVVPMYPRHPIVLANQVQTVQAASGGRFTLGLGLGAQPVAEGVYGVSYDRPIRHLRDYVAALRGIFAGEKIDIHGETLTASTTQLSTVVGGAAPVPIVVAAMGEQALRVTAEVADGTLPYLAGPRTIAETIVPALAASGRPSLRVVAAVPAVVTSNVDEVVAQAEKELSFYDSIPSYQKVLAAENLSRAAQLALIGDEETVAAGVRAYFEAGATEVLLAQTGLGSARDMTRTWALAGALARESSHNAREGRA
ncbi:TIGR03564 family F420-dependent LLM class oxidoreductase [Fodinicola feengrottensis]|uniref:TIGR03564 family F420-dependent LLM class oxidoreductase n=1 Tax=Fodinicola feengrottensis TaxID=435914 RepID=A0ABN2H3J8_9ACTN